MSVALRHQAVPSMRSTNRSKRYAASCGPAAASGWYWTEKRLQRAVGVAQLEALDHVVVEADVADRRRAVRRLGRRRRAARRPRSRGCAR